MSQKMTFTVLYWVNHYETETDWKNGDTITITGDKLFDLSKKFDVAILTSKTKPHVVRLAIDELGGKFRQR